MIQKFENVLNLIKEIDAKLKHKVNIFLIGGAVLLYHKIKTATKDIDIVVNNLEEFDALNNTLRDVGFQSKLPTLEYRNMNLSNILVREDFRIDLFNRDVCSGFSLSKGMIKRSKAVAKLSHATLFLISSEDIFLFKTMTEREGDLADCVSLAKMGVRWNVIIEELQNQIKTSGRKVWITWVGERMDLLEERGLNIPIMNSLNKLRKEYFDELDRK